MRNTHKIPAIITRKLMTQVMRFIIIIIIVPAITYMQAIYNYIPETKHVSTV